MAITPNNIEIGEGNLTLQFTNDVAPVDVGACEAMTLNFAPKKLKVKCGQTMYPIQSFIIDNECKGSVELVEATMRNIVAAFGGDPNDIVEDGDKYTYTFGGGSVAEVPTAELIYAAPRVREPGKFRTLTLFKVESEGGLQLNFKKDKEQRIKFEFTALADPDNDNAVGTYEIEKYS